MTRTLSCRADADLGIFVDEGHPPDPRTMSTLHDNGIVDYEHLARKVQVADFDTFDYILGMDNENVHGRTSPAHYCFVQADREHRDSVSVLPCSPRKNKN